MSVTDTSACEEVYADGILVSLIDSSWLGVWVERTCADEEIEKRIEESRENISDINSACPSFK